ncbi:MAG: VCBS repeat-containing protein, partial [Planctomycetota bacterium]|nr:VCBS repeat-containing protein [Planctomycetota bacterium]
MALAFRRTGTRSGARGWRLALGLVVLVPIGYRGLETLWHRAAANRDGAVVLELVTKEELILQLTPKLEELSGSLLNLKLPDPQSRGQFDESVWSVDLGADPPKSRRELGSVGTVLDELPVARDRVTSPAAGVDLWRPLLDDVAYFEHARFYFVDGRLAGRGYDRFEGDVGFAGLARMKSGEWKAVKGRQTVHWRRLPARSDGAPDEAAGAADDRDDADTDGTGTDAPEWRISGWEMRTMETASSRQLLFVESLNRALPDAGDLGRARRSLHQQAAIRYYEGGAQVLPSRYFAAISANQKPGLSVVDIDGDGFDDLYVMVRMGKNQLLRNRGDGTFEEVAARFGLDIPGNSTCGIFADFDNDGDPDLMLGRSLERSMYLENAGGRFSERAVGLALPYLAISLAAADYNADGLLDVYLSTYRPAVLAGAGKSGGDSAAAGKWPQEFLGDRQAKEYYRRHSQATGGPELFSNFLDQVGPPNVLLVNRGGGRFEIAPESPRLELW